MARRRLGRLRDVFPALLGDVCRPVIDHHDSYAKDGGGGLILNYRQLPDAVETAILQHFGILCGPEERERIRCAAQHDAKSPGQPFAADADAKQRAASDTIRRAAGCHLGEIYRRLEVLSVRPERGLG